MGMGKHSMLKVCYYLCVCVPEGRECMSVICITCLFQEEEGLGNPEGTMVMEDNQTTPPPEPTEELAEQHRTTHSLTEVSTL